MMGLVGGGEGNGSRRETLPQPIMNPGMQSKYIKSPISRVILFMFNLRLLSSNDSLIVCSTLGQWDSIGVVLILQFLF